MKTILVTGGAGFIGTNLCLQLLQYGHKVIAFDNLSSSVMPSITHTNYNFFQGNVNEPIPIHVKIDEIYHLACPASPIKYQSDPLYTIKTCVDGTINVLELARKNKCPVLFTSSSEIYGEALISPQHEEYRGNVNIIGIRSCYDEGKRMAETIMFEYHRIYNVDIHVCRLFNTYGPHMQPDDGRVISNFIMQYLANKPFTVYGTGFQTRSFCFVDDTVDGIIRFMASQETGPLNIGNPVEVSILDLLKLIKNNFVQLNCELPSDDPTHRCPDISVAKRVLDWYPKTSLQDGLRQTIQYFRDSSFS